MTKKWLLTLVVIGALGTVAAVATFAAFTGTAANPGNTFSAGTVVIGDNDADTALYNLTNQKPGTSTVQCVKLTYTGSLAADVKLYTPSTLNAGAQYINVTVEKGTVETPEPAYPGCGTYTAQGTVYSGTLQGLATAHNTWANGAAVYPGAQTSWATNDALVFRFTVSVQDTNAAQGATSGTHSFTWEARNQ